MPARRPTLPLLTRALLLALAAAAAAPAARGHDTWFESLGDPAPGGWPLALGTGNLFPLRETAIDPRHIVASGCDRGPLVPGAVGEQALALRAPADAGTCWLQLDAFEVELPPALVETYLREVNPPPAVRAAWQAMAARGQPWRERYVKHARVVRAGALAPQPAGLGLDVLLEGTAPHRFRVLRDGQPLAGFAVELRHERAQRGVWRRTDAEGRLEFTPPLPGAWLLRGIDLRVAADDPARWDSRFVTLAFAVQNGISSSPNARSTNQPAATAAMSHEPSPSTPRR